MDTNLTFAPRKPAFGKAETRLRSGRTASSETLSHSLTVRKVQLARSSLLPCATSQCKTQASAYDGPNF
jgi:hypothetical protein